jgi:hypothetical protein
MKKLAVSFGNFVNKLNNETKYRKKTTEWVATDELEKGCGSCGQTD